MFGQPTKPKNNPDLEYFTIYDSKTESYREPSLAINRHDLIRQFTNMMKDPGQTKNLYYTNAEDYSIYKVGEFDRKTGIITSTPHEHVVNLHELRSIVHKETKTPDAIFGATENRGH